MYMYMDVAPNESLKELTTEEKRRGVLPKLHRAVHSTVAQTP